MPPLFEWRIMILILALLNLLMCLCVEYVLGQWTSEQKIKPKTKSGIRSMKNYVQLEQELEKDYNWPVMKEELFPASITHSEESKTNINAILCRDGQSSNEQMKKENKNGECRIVFNNLAFVEDE